MLKQIFRFIFTCLSVMALAGQLGAAPVPKDTPFGVTFTTANFQSGGTISDQLETFASIVQVGSTVMFVYLWGNSNQERIEDLRTQVAIARQHNLKVFIQFSSVGRGIPTPPDDLPKTWSSEEVRDRYLLDLTLLAQLQPDYLNISPEVNIMAYFEPDEFNIYKEIYPNAYNLVKSVSPTTRIGLSYLDVLWVGRDQAGLPDELGARDFIGITTYPDGIFGSIDEIPAGWYEQIRNAYPDEPIIFTEVGWGSTDPSDMVKQADFVAALPELFKNIKPELVIWALLHESGFFQVRFLDQEALNFLASVDVDPDVLFRKFNSLGLLAADGTPKPAWYEAMMLNFTSSE